MQSNPSLRRIRAGFTLIEMLAVLLILSILTYFLVVNLKGATEAVGTGNARALLSQMSAMIAQQSDDNGDFPPSQLAADLGASNTLNVGSECLYLALCAEGAPGYGKLDREKDLCNTDRDSLSKRPKGFEKQDLYELADPWGNPIVYIHHRDYEREFQVVCLDTQTGEETQYTVRAKKNPATGRFQEPQGFQLLSAGGDGIFGGESEDDLANFTIKK
ncbi:MAG TPA: prepilin-type N-terminal cleavage/methylation domain-containing protein [Planctomycetota bacterium]|nr:prepilin-type N-terminal cleavage/methylation domain-containing protein [Planctomycetota bacterium]